jgi:GNAT superfamily N-acetyltransferase
MAMRIEQADSHDTEPLCRLFNQARASAEGLDCQSAITLDEFRLQIAGESLFVARVQGEIAGFVSVWVADNFIHHLFVAPAYQGRGIGQVLLRYCQKLHGLPLSLKCVEANRRACRFYEQNGWIEKQKATGPDGPYRLYRLDN